MQRVWRTVDDVLQRGALVGERLELGRVELLRPVALVHLRLLLRLGVLEVAHEPQRLRRLEDGDLAEAERLEERASRARCVHQQLVSEGAATAAAGSTVAAARVETDGAQAVDRGDGAREAEGDAKQQRHLATGQQG